MTHDFKVFSLRQTKVHISNEKVKLAGSPAVQLVAGDIFLILTHPLWHELGGLGAPVGQDVVVHIRHLRLQLGHRVSGVTKPRVCDYLDNTHRQGLHELMLVP